jgi:Tat protein secretion system quality control protein TatD with DNase activity
MQISLLAGFISCLKEVSLEEVAIKTTKNAVSFFNLK